ncbi:MAG: hypothetical protein L6R39_004607, partial [Caloplaca ligustica]
MSALQHVQYRPRWLQRFVDEQIDGPKTFGAHGVKKARLGLPTTLLALTLWGTITQVVQALLWVHDVTTLPRVLAWAAAILLVAVDRPRTAPVGILVISCSLLLSQLTLTFYDIHTRSLIGIFRGCDVLAALLSISFILYMPLRDPHLPIEGIGLAFEKPTHLLRSPEDNLTLWQFMSVSWMSPLISLGSARQLNSEDVWKLSFEFQHRLLHDKFRELGGSVVRRLLSANGLDLLILSTLGAVEALCSFAQPVLLQQLLRAMEEVSAPRSKAIAFAVLTLLVRLAACQSSVFSLWFSRRSYERSRGEMITMLYEKTLSRKIIGELALSDKPHMSEGNVDGPALDSDTVRDGLEARPKDEQRPIGKLGLYIRRIFWKPSIKEDIKQAASIGKIYNLMRNDVYEVAQRFWEFQSLIRVPLSLVLSVVLVWKLIGWPCLFGVLTVAVAQIVNALTTRILLRYERKRRAVTDQKLKKVTQYVGAIRHLRWYGWQDFWQEQIMQARQQELRLFVVTGLLRTLISVSNYLASDLFPVAAFFAYTILAGKPLRIDIAFPALQLFGMLENSLREVPRLITVLLNAKIAVDRIEDFMIEPDKDDAMIRSSLRGRPQIKLQNATFAWPGTSHQVLHNISLDISVGLTVICGKVAAGKTALLQALLGELEWQGGDVALPNDCVGYCAQTPWLQSMSIRENILFTSPYEEGRYRRVLEACALIQDLAAFKDGDLTNIGENGTGLSGGQKARVALARAIYSPAKILLLDDPLSALDHQTAETIVRKCLCGLLAEGRTVVLVTHRTVLCQQVAKQVIELSEGRCRILDRDTVPSLDLSRVVSSESADKTKRDQQDKDNEDSVPEKFMDEEKRAHGGVKATVYWKYVKAGKLKWWAVLVVILALHRLVEVAETWFLKAWGEAYDRPQERVASGLFNSLPSPEVNARPWLLVFFLVVIVEAAVFWMAQCFMIVITYTAGRGMFKEVMNRVSHATFRFYDVTPVGRLMNRLTSDIGTVDGNITDQFEDAAFLAIAWVSSIAIIASVTPVFLVFSFSLTALFVLIFRRFLPTSQSLRRLEMVSLSPLMSNFGALLDGLTTVRAFRAQRSFQDRLIAVTDAFQGMDHFYWSLQAWLMYRFDALSACSTFVLTLLALYTGVSPGLTAFVLLAASGFVRYTHALCKRYGQLQMDFVSVERVVELLHLDQEPPGPVLPPAWWPSSTGDIVFEDVTVRYAPHLEPSLRNISLRIPAGSITALLGRTGSGKSTLALSLLGVVKPECGRILIDGVNVANVDTQALRTRITFLAQEPLLFPGTLHMNLDPLSKHPRSECAAVLARVAGTDHQHWTLDTEVEAGGKNLSQGQRQLVGLARAVLRRSSVVVLDEATASVDAETAGRVLRVLREELVG